jgi:hypothetical protein
MFVIKTRVGPSTIHGTGVFAGQDVPLGGEVWRFNPPFDLIINDSDLDGLPTAAKEFIEMYAYHCMDLGGKLVLSGDHARFLNHSDDPNTEERPFVSIARKPIFSGDEITCDYSAFCTGWTGFETVSTQSASSESGAINGFFPHRNLYTRLKKSEHGVGLFAIRDIPENLRLFAGDAGPVVRVPSAVVNGIPDSEVRRIYFDFCPTSEGRFLAPSDFNQLTMSWYMNHSTSPNVQADENLQFVSRRPIAIGEELTINYTSFSEHAPAQVARWSAHENSASARKSTSRGHL